MPILPIFRGWDGRLSFERSGRCVAAVVVPEGSTLEHCPFLACPDSTLLMVPSEDDSCVRYGWTATDVVVESGFPGARFEVVEFDNYSRSNHVA